MRKHNLPFYVGSEMKDEFEGKWFFIITQIIFSPNTAIGWFW